MRFYLEAGLIVLVAGGLFYWKTRPAAPVLPPPAYEGARPKLDMPAPGRAPAPYVESSLENVRYGSRPPAASRKYAETVPIVRAKSPQMLAGRSAPSVDAPGAAGTLPPEKDWSDYLRDPRAQGAVAALFFVAYVLLSRALRRGPGGRGFTRL